eukprot:ANDGO_02180.mRNA.1 Sulfate transporter 4.1
MSGTVPKRRRGFTVKVNSIASPATTNASRTHFGVSSEKAVAPVEELIAFHADIVCRMKDKGVPAEWMSKLISQCDPVLEKTCSTLEVSWELSAGNAFQHLVLLAEAKERIFVAMYSIYGELKNDPMIKDMVSVIDIMFREINTLGNVERTRSSSVHRLPTTIATGSSSQVEHTDTASPNALPLLTVSREYGSVPARTEIVNIRQHSLAEVQDENARNSQYMVSGMSHQESSMIVSSAALEFLRQRKLSKYWSMTTLSSMFPLISWLPKYNWRKDLTADCLAGLTVGCMLVPQSMAYALIAGLPVISGLYTGLFPILAYFPFGTSRHLCVGPIPLSSLVVSATISAIGYDSMTEAAAMGSMLAIFAGAIHFLLGVARMGFVVNFLSRPVMSGFTSAGCILIMLSQVKYVLGITVTQHPEAWYTFYEICRNLPNSNWVTLLFAFACVIVLAFGKIKTPTFPMPLLLVVVGVLVSWGFNFEGDHKVKVVGDIPSGVPSPRIPDYPADKMLTLFLASFVVTIVDFMESYSIAKMCANRTNYSINGSQELIGIGASGLISGFFGGYVSGGAMSRTIVNFNAGGRTLVGSLVTFVTMLIFLEALTALIYYLPLACLGAIILVALPSLLDYREAIFCWKNNRSDFWNLAVAFFLTLVVGIEVGVFTAIALSLVLVINRASKPHVAVLGRLPGTLIYRNVHRFPEALTYPGVLVVRLDANMFFANSAFFEDTLVGMIDLSKELAATSEYERRRRSDAYLNNRVFDEYRVVVLECSPVNEVDSTALHVLETILDKLKQRNVVMLLACVKDAVYDNLERSKLMQRLPEGQASVFLHVHSAVIRACQIVEQNSADALLDKSLVSAENAGASQLETAVVNVNNERFETSSPSSLASPGTARFSNTLAEEGSSVCNRAEVDAGDSHENSHADAHGVSVGVDVEDICAKVSEDVKPEDKGASEEDDQRE